MVRCVRSSSIFPARQSLLALSALCLFLLAPSAVAAEPGPDFSRLAPCPPCAALTSAARARLIPLDLLDPPGAPGKLNPGDSFTGLVTLCEKGGRRTQWLFYLTALPASPKSLAHGEPKPWVLYSGRSNRFEYASSPALVQLRMLGPFAASAANRDRLKAEDNTVTFALNEGFLGLGLDQAAATIARAGKAKHGGALFWFGGDPPNAAQMAESRKLGEQLKLTLEEERALGGGIPALLSYGDVVQHFDVLEGIMEKVVQKPSIWSVIGHLGVNISLVADARHFAPADLHAIGWPLTTPAHYFPMRLELNGNLALTVTFLVTQPRPPLLSCGGIIGMLAENPGEKETYLTLRVISARCSTGQGSVEALKR